MPKDKTNLFAQFGDGTQNSDGLKTIERTKITLTTEHRTKRVNITMTPSEYREIRDLSRQLEEETGQRAPISDMSRDLWLILLGKEEGQGAYHDRLRKMLKDRFS